MYANLVLLVLKLKVKSSKTSKYIKLFQQSWCLVIPSCPALSNPVDCSPPGTSVHGILQARTLEWVAVPFSRGSTWPREWICIPCVMRSFLTSEPLGKPNMCMLCLLVSQSCLTLRNPMDYSLPGSSVHGPDMCMWMCNCLIWNKLNPSSWTVVVMVEEKLTVNYTLSLAKTERKSCPSLP